MKFCSQVICEILLSSHLWNSVASHLWNSVAKLFLKFCCQANDLATEFHKWLDNRILEMTWQQNFRNNLATEFHKWLATEFHKWLDNRISLFLPVLLRFMMYKIFQFVGCLRFMFNELSPQIFPEEIITRVLIWSTSQHVRFHYMMRWGTLV